MPPLSSIFLFCSVLMTFILKFYCFQSIFYTVTHLFLLLVHFGPSEIIQFLIWQSFSKLLSKIATQHRPFFSCIDYNVTLFLYDLLNSMIKKSSFELYWCICNLWKKSLMILKSTLSIWLLNWLSILHKKQEYQKRLQQNCWHCNYTEPGMFTVCIHMTWWYLIDVFTQFMIANWSQIDILSMRHDFVSVDTLAQMNTGAQKIHILYRKFHCTM